MDEFLSVITSGHHHQVVSKIKMHSLGGGVHGGPLGILCTDFETFEVSNKVLKYKSFWGKKMA